MSATKILWGQITVVFLIVLSRSGRATQWTAWRLGFQPELGPPWFELAGMPVYLPAGLLLVVVRLRRLCATDLRRGRLHRRVRRLHLDRGRHRHVGLAGPGGEERRDLWIGALGRRRRGEGSRAARAGWRRAGPARTATISVTTARSMCCASRRPVRAKASALSCRRF